MATANSRAVAAGIPSDAQIVSAGKGVAHSASATAFDATRGIHANGSETIVVDFARGATGVSLVVVAGMSYPYSITKCSTTASGIVLLY